MEKNLSERQSLPCTATHRRSGNIRLLWLMLGCIAALLLTGCGMNTDLNIDGEFKGERIITCDELSDQNGLFTKFKVSEAADVLSRKCPPQMSFECKYTNDTKTKAVFVFHLKFDSIDDYRAKVRELIGRNPGVQFTYKDPKADLFASGFSVTEDFESKDLLAWVKPALKDELNVSKDVSVSGGKERRRLPVFRSYETVRACSESLHARLACIFSAIFCPNPR